MLNFWGANLPQACNYIFLKIFWKCGKLQVFCKISLLFIVVETTILLMPSDRIEWMMIVQTFPHSVFIHSISSARHARCHVLSELGTMPTLKYGGNLLVSSRGKLKIYWTFWGWLLWASYCHHVLEHWQCRASACNTTIIKFFSKSFLLQIPVLSALTSNANVVHFYLSKSH